MIPDNEDEFLAEVLYSVLCRQTSNILPLQKRIPHTDGLTNHVSDEEIIKCTCDDEIFNYADRLVKLANEKGGSDNITAVVLVG